VQRATDGLSQDATVLQFDWRFLAPIVIVDLNENVSQVQLDALGRVQHHRFHGTETPAGTDHPVRVGYSPDTPFTAPATVADALALNQTKGVPVHEAFTIITDSWMPWERDAQGKRQHRRSGELAWRRRLRELERDGRAQYLTASDIMDERSPPHVITIQTDRYDDDPAQRVRVQVSLSGGGQVLQTAILNEQGDAFVRTADGGLQADGDGKAVSASTEVRWAVTGRTEFDNKGQAVRAWLPFYLDDWRWVRDDSAREGIHADTHLYDALGRECKVIRADGEWVGSHWVGYERRVQVYPWFIVSEDENDTRLDVVERARTRAHLH